eukprot:PITA_10970
MNSLFALYFHVDEPIHFEDTIKDKKWIEAMDEEMNAIERNKTWDLVELPKGKDAIGVKWVYKTKSNAEGKNDRHKERLVVKGYKQQQGKDYDESFAPVARMETVTLTVIGLEVWMIGKAKPVISFTWFQEQFHGLLRNNPALSTAEVEYVAATATMCQAVWMRRMLRSLCQEQPNATVIFCDNDSAIALSKNFVFHKRTKHVDTRFHYIRELVNNGEIVLKHCKNQEQVADIVTKPLGEKSFEFFRKCLGITHKPAVEIKEEC